MDILELANKIFTIFIAAASVAAMLKKPFDKALHRLEQIEKCNATIVQTQSDLQEEVKAISNNQTRGNLNSSMQKIEIKQELHAKITDSEVLELEGQFIDYKKKGGNGHMEARYNNLIKKVGNHGL